MEPAPVRPKLAAVVTVYRKYSHAQHICDRFLEGYGWRGDYHRPPMDLVSLYVDQVPHDDLSRERASRHPSLTIYPGIAEALTLGTGKLAVDGVILVGEHGDYPHNEKGQTKYPRYEFFQQITSVFRSSQRSVPVFNDKHLSWNWTWAQEMVNTSGSLGFPLMAGSSLPVTWRIPSIEMPLGATVREALCICYGGVDSYDFHGFETLQCMLERRKGGETGVRSMKAWRGEEFWKAHAAGAWSKDLFHAALCRSHTLTPARPGFNDIFPSTDQMKELLKDPVAFSYEHEDGARCSVLLLNGLIRDFNFAARLDNPSKIISTQMYLPMPDGRTTLASFFSPLAFHMETLFTTRRSPYPVARTLLTTGLTAAGVESLYQNQARIATPHLSVAYQPSAESFFERS
jgi:hypothetical protein